MKTIATEADADSTFIVPYSFNDFLSRSFSFSSMYLSCSSLIPMIIKKDTTTVKNETKYEMELLNNLLNSETCKFYQLTSVGSGALWKLQLTDLSLYRQLKTFLKKSKK